MNRLPPRYRNKKHAMATRRAVFARDRGRCALCGKVTRDWQVHHSVAVREGGGCCPIELLQTLCREPCHRRESAEQRRRWAHERRFLPEGIATNDQRKAEALGTTRPTNGFECAYADLPDGFDLESCVGRNARLRVLHEPKNDGGVRAVIQSIESWEGAVAVPDNFTRKPGRGAALNGTVAPAYGGAQNQAVAPPGAPMPPTNRPAPAPPTTPQMARDRPITEADMLTAAEVVAVVQSTPEEAYRRGVTPADYNPAGLSNNPAAAQQQAHAAQLAAGYDDAMSDPDVFDLPEGSPAQREALAAAHVG